MWASAHCETWGLCLRSCFFSLKKKEAKKKKDIFFSRSQLEMSTAQSSHPRSFEYLQVLLKSYVSQSLSQWVMCVSCSWLNVVSSLQRMLSNTAPERQAGSEAGHDTRPQRHYKHSPLMLLLLTKRSIFTSNSC